MKGSGSGKKCLKLSAFILLSVIYAAHPGKNVWASDRLADFSDMVRDLDAEAEAPAQSVNEGNTGAPAQSANDSKTGTPAQSTKEGNTGTPAQGANDSNTGNTAQSADTGKTVAPAQSGSKTAAPAANSSRTEEPESNNSNKVTPAINGSGTVSPLQKAEKSGVPVRNDSGSKTPAKSTGTKKIPVKYKTMSSGTNRFTSVSELLLTAGAETCMDGKVTADASEETGAGNTGSDASGKAGGNNGSTGSTGSGAVSGKTETGSGGERLSDFAQLVRNAETEAGITDSDPESDPVASFSDVEDAGRLSEFAALAGGQDEGASGGDARLEEFAHLAGEQGGSGVDARLVEFAELSGGSSDMVDDRIIALARASDEREKEMEEKYGPRIEDNIVSRPSDYKDGDRIVATANTKTESAMAYASSGSWDRADTESGESGIGKLFGSIYSGLTRGKNTSDSREEAETEDFSVSGFFTNMRDRIRSFVYSDEEKISLGTFSLTAYDACIECCGKTDGITSTGTHAKAGRTIAVDPNVIPYGSRVLINDKVYIAEDTGGAIKGNKIDIYMNTHEEARQFGRHSAEVFLLR